MNYVILVAHVTMATSVSALIYLWYVAPRLSVPPLLVALQPWLLVQAFRFTGLTLAVDGQVDPEVPSDVLLQAGLGDMATALLAVAALVLARRGSGAAVAVTWVVTVVGLLDFASADRRPDRPAQLRRRRDVAGLDLVRARGPDLTPGHHQHPRPQGCA